MVNATRLYSATVYFFQKATFRIPSRLHLQADKDLKDRTFERRNHNKGATNIQTIESCGNIDHNFALGVEWRGPKNKVGVVELCRRGWGSG